MIGSDTDSIAAFVGGLGGAAFGLEVISEKWRSQIQDAPFLICIGEYGVKTRYAQNLSRCKVL